MAQTNSVISLDPIDRKKQKGPLGRLLITQWSGGKSVTKSDLYGHYMFCGPQRAGKTSSVLWYAEKLNKKYKRKKLSYADHSKCDEDHLLCKYIKFDTVPKVKLYSNIDIGQHIDKSKIFDTIDAFDENANEVRIVLIDEIHTYFPKDGRNKETQQIKEDLIAIFSQLRKRNTYILSTAQVYGRLDKGLREQCLYMINCKVTMSKKLLNEFIKGDDVMCDDLGRWSGDPKFIYIHGLSKLNYNTKKIIRS